jgi:hypothetical protein
LFNEGASLGVVDQADYDFWKANFGKTASIILHDGTAVPEPTTFAILIISIASAELIGRTISRSSSAKTMRAAPEPGVVPQATVDMAFGQHSRCVD